MFTVDCHWSEQSLVDAPNLGHWAASQTASLPGLSLPSCRARAQGRRRRMFFFHPRHFGATLGRFGSVLVHENTHTGGDSVTFVERKQTSCVNASLFLSLERRTCMFAAHFMLVHYESQRRPTCVKRKARKQDVVHGVVLCGPPTTKKHATILFMLIGWQK